MAAGPLLVEPPVLLEAAEAQGARLEPQGRGERQVPELAPAAGLAGAAMLAEDASMQMPPGGAPAEQALPRKV